MAFCEQCGVSNAGDAEFCTGCGRRLSPDRTADRGSHRNPWLLPVLTGAVVIVMTVVAIVWLSTRSDQTSTAGGTIAPNAIAATTQPAEGTTDTLQPAASTTGLHLVSPLRADEVIATQPTGLMILDVRTEPEFATGRLSEAINIDLYDSGFGSRLDRFDKEAPYVVYDRTGSRSAEATAAMAELGFTNVYEIDGGIIAWTQAGLPIEQDPGSAVSASETTTAPPTSLASLKFSYFDSKYPSSREGEPAYSGCSPGTPEHLPDGVWYGFAPSWSSTEIIFDLACIAWVHDTSCDCSLPKVTNNNDLLRSLPFASNAVAYGLDRGNYTGPMSIAEFTSDPGRDADAYRHVEGLELMISVNNGLVTEIVIPYRS